MEKIKKSWVFSTLDNMQHMGEENKTEKRINGDHEGMCVVAVEIAAYNQEPLLFMVDAVFSVDDYPGLKKKLENKTRYKERFSDRENKIHQRCYGLMKHFYKESEAMIQRRIFNAMFSLREILPRNTRSPEEFKVVTDLENYNSMRDGDIVSVRFKEGQGRAIFAGVKTNQQEVCFIVVWIENFQIDTSKGRISFAVGDESYVPPSSVEKYYPLEDVG